MYRGPLGGLHATTRTYAHDPKVGPSRTSQASRTSRFLAFTGMKPWDRHRAAWFGWVLLVLWAFGTAAVLGVAVLAVSAVAFGGLRWRRAAVERATRVPRSVTAGPAWCDHCADWTVHGTDQHVS